MCGGSAAVTELGGDYFDLIDHGSGKVTVILGDAAGHGVPAALIMAIVKAAIFLEDDLWERPLDVLQRIHEQLYALQGKPRKLMTLQLLNLDGTSGLGRLANAGQAYPFLLQNGTATLVEVPSRPLGVFRRASLNSCNIRLNPGDYLVMYSDGMVEALMPTGEMVGYDRCLELAAHTARFPATEFYAALRAGHRQLAPTLADDATFVVVGLAPEEPVGRMAEGAPA
jgi:sigma-B regulation protein RsbU (phosphoserine phosphatase)